MARGSFYKGDNRGRLFSGFWANCPANKIMAGAEDGQFFFDDFDHRPADTATEDGRYTVDESDVTGGIAEDATDTGAYGVWKYTLDATDNDELWIQVPTAICKIDANAGKVWFEARVKKTVITDNELALLIGIAIPAAVGDDVYQADDTGICSSVSIVGFQTVHDNGEEIDTIHSTATSITTVKANAGTLVADTYKKFGIYFDGISKITYFLDGVALADTVLESATNFPDGILLSPVFAVKNGAATANIASIDWWACAHQING